MRSVVRNNPSDFDVLSELFLLLVQPEQRVQRAHARQVDRAKGGGHLLRARVHKRSSLGRGFLERLRAPAEEPELCARLAAGRGKRGMTRLVQLLSLEVSEDLPRAPQH